MIQKKKQKGKHYVSNPVFYAALVERRAEIKRAEEEGKQKPIISRYLAECIMNIAEKLSHRPNFIGYSYRDEMVQDAVDNCLSYGLDRFDPEKSKNPFAYFTQIAFNAFKLRIQKEKKQMYIRYKLAENMHVNGQMADVSEHDESSAWLNGSSQASSGKGQSVVSSYMETAAEFIQKYENSVAEKKAKKIAQDAANKSTGNQKE
jgi:hypothetical protein